MVVLIDPEQVLIDPAAACGIVVLITEQNEW